MKIMDYSEQIVFQHLKRLYGDVVPQKDDPPDMVVNPSIGVEVRRLNLNFFKDGKIEGLENLSSDLFVVVDDVLDSLNSLHTGKKSYWVDVDYQRPLTSDFRHLKKEMKQVLRNFLALNTTNFPYRIFVNSEITFLLRERHLNDGNLFRVSGSIDFNFGGAEISVYAQNLRHCITEKSSKIRTHLPKYNEWWLYLVDQTGFSLDQKEISKVVNMVENTGNFDKVFILSYDGQNIIATMSK